ncbi:hypothetical protein M758_7G129900 [Ceratodon purpureus]|nr:hypothetical protein M758_7G129900 [Ceratodon purpureus]
MGNSQSRSFGKKARNSNFSGSRISRASSSTTDPLPQVNLEDYEAACKADPDVKRFDDKLHTRTQEALSSLAEGVERPGQGVSFKSLKDVTTSLLEVDNEVVHVILAYKEDVWANKELMDLVTEYLNTSLEALDFCGVLEKCVQQTRDNLELHLQVAINHMPAEGEPTQQQSESVLKELQGFVRAANPFSEDFSNQFMTVYQRHLEMQNKLQVKKKKLDTKLRSVRGWMKVSNIILGATCAAVLLCRVIADAIAAPRVAVDLAEESKKPGRGMGSWLKPLCRRYEQIRAQTAIIEDASKGTFVAIQDLNNIKASVERLKNETAAITRNIRFGEDRRHDPYSLQVAVEAIRRKQAAFIDQLEDLRETVIQSRGRINRARTVVLVRILENRDVLFKNDK